MDGAFLLTTLCILLLAALGTWRRAIRRRLRLPPSPGPSFPVIGHFHLLKQPLHRSLAALSQKHGPIISLQFGSRLVVVVSSPSLAEECFTKNDVVLANRPRLAVGRYIGYNNTTIVGSPYGDHWRNLRRLSSIEIFSSVRLNAFLSIRQQEIELLLRNLGQNSGGKFAKVELRPRFSELSFNVIMRMVSGKRYFGENADMSEEARRFRETIGEVFRYSGANNPGDFLPVLRWIDYGGVEKKLSTIGREMDGLLQGLIEEKRRKKDGSTMIDHLLGLQESQPEYYTDQIIKGMAMILITAGTDTSSTTMEWAMSELLNHPDVIQKARKEIEAVVGPDRLLDEPDLPKIDYLQHIIWETLRLHPAAPLLVPHESSADCSIGGYGVPAGTILLVNAWAMQRDPTVWDEPAVFRPERFEKGGSESHFKLMPFGMGRRSCPGAGLALRVLGLALGSLIQCFEWERVGGEEAELDEVAGITTPKAKPLVAMCKARDILHKLSSC